MKLWAIVPELVVASLCLCLVPVAGWVRGRWTAVPALLAVAGLLFSLAWTARMLSWAPLTIMGGTYAVDGFATVFKLLIQTGAIVTILLLTSYLRGHDALPHAPIAVLFATLGALALVSSADLGLIVLFIEMMSLATYVLAALLRSEQVTLEATLKYFVFGAAALAVMAYGLSFLYGLAGTLDLQAMAGRLAHGADKLWIGTAFSMILVGFGFEITMVPFQFWAPDVFSGASAPVSGFLSVVPKTAALGGLLRLMLIALPTGAVGWPTLLAVLAGITMTFGNLLALRQEHLKRLLAYSSIGQAGYLLMTVAASSRAQQSPAAVAYYLAAYLFANLGAFAVVAQVERTLGSDNRKAFYGLGRRSPVAAVVLTLSLFSLAGIPPLAGFAGKILLLESTLAGGLSLLAIIAALNMAVSLYYYVSVLADLWLKSPQHTYRMDRGLGYSLTYGITVAGSFFLGIWPGPNLELARLVSRLIG